MVKETIREQINAFDGLNLGTVSQRVHTPWLFGAVAFAGIYYLGKNFRRLFEH